MTLCQQQVLMHRARKWTEHIVDTLPILDDANKCVNYVSNIRDLQVLLIVDKSNCTLVVRRLLDVSQLRSVYILWSNIRETQKIKRIEEQSGTNKSHSFKQWIRSDFKIKYKQNLLICTQIFHRMISSGWVWVWM